MKRLLAFAPLLLLAIGCGPHTPTELVPTFTSLTGLPGLPPSDGCSGEDCCLEAGWCLDVETLTLRNVGSSTVTIESVAFKGGSDPAFKELQLSAMELGPDEQANVRFRYTTPTGAAQSGTIVITSDAEVNPTLEIGVETLPYTPRTSAPSETDDEDDEDDESGTGGEDPEDD